MTTTRTLPGFSGYRFRSDGEVVSVQRGAERVLAGGLDKDGYRKFVLIHDDMSRRYVRRASLICEAFHGPRAAGMTVRHLDGSKTNDAADNLAWGTQRENIRDKYRHGTIRVGSAHHSAKLTEAQVVEIKSSPLGTRELARRFGVSTGAIHGVRAGLTWRHLWKAA